MMKIQEEEEVKNQSSNYAASKARLTSEERKKLVIPRHKDPDTTITNIAVSLNVSLPRDQNHLRTKLSSSRLKSSRLLPKGQFSLHDPGSEKFEDISLAKVSKRASSVDHQRRVNDMTSRGQTTL